MSAVCRKFRSKTGTRLVEQSFSSGSMAIWSLKVLKMLLGKVWHIGHDDAVLLNCFSFGCPLIWKNMGFPISLALENISIYFLSFKKHPYQIPWFWVKSCTKMEARMRSSMTIIWHGWTSSKWKLPNETYEIPGWQSIPKFFHHDRGAAPLACQQTS